MAQYSDSSRDYVDELAEQLPYFVQKNKPNRLVVTLYPENVGYSLSLLIGTREHNIIEYRYEDDKILSYINRGELMPMIEDLFREFRYELFYHNCMIGEIRDCRFSNNYEPKYIYLKTSNFRDIRESERKRIKLSDSWEFENSVRNCSPHHPSQNSLHNGSLPDSPPVDINHFDMSLNWRTSSKKYLFPDSTISSNDRLIYKSEKVWKKRGIISETAVKPSSLFGRNYAEQSPRNFNHLIDVKAEFASKPLWDVSESDVLHKVDSYWNCYVQKEFYKSYVMELLPKDYPKNTNIVQSAEVTITKIPGEEQYYGKLSIKSPSEHASSSSEFLLGSRERVDKFIKKYTDVFTVEDTKPVKKQEIENGITKISFTKAVRNIVVKDSTGERSAESGCSSNGSFNISSILAKPETTCNGVVASGIPTMSETLKLLPSLSSCLFQ